MSARTNELWRKAATVFCIVLLVTVIHHFRSKLPTFKLPAADIYAPLIKGGYTPEEAQEFYALLPQMQLKAQETYGRDLKALSPDELLTMYGMVKLPIINQKVARGQPLTMKEQEIRAAWQKIFDRHRKP